MICHSISRKRTRLKTVLTGLLFIACFGAMAVHAGEDAAVQEGPGEVRLTTESMPLGPPPASGKRPLEDDHGIMHGTIDVPAGAGQPEAPADTTPLPKTSPSLNNNPSTPAAASATGPGTEAVKNRQRVAPSPTYKGPSIAATRTTGAPSAKEKQYSPHKQAQTTRAQSVKSEVAHADSPELQAYNEKRKRIKDHFKAQLENRPERKAKKAKN